MGERAAAALELIKARNNLRELIRAGMATRTDTQHVQDAQARYLAASKEK